MSVTQAVSRAVGPQCVGLFDRWGKPPVADWLALVSGWTIHVWWQDLQPEPYGNLDLGCPTRDSSGAASVTLTAAIEEARAAGATVRLRVLDGIRAPVWVKTLGGAELPYVHNEGGTVGRWWRDDYQEAQRYRDLLLAAAVDRDPVIGEIAATGPMTEYAEPMLRHVNGADAVNITTLLNAGYSRAGDEAAFGAMADRYQALWMHTRVSIALNPLTYINPDGTTGSDLAFGKSLATDWRAALRNRGVLGNNSIRHNDSLSTSPRSNGSPIKYLVANGYPTDEPFNETNISNPYWGSTAVGGTVVGLYEHIAELGPPIYFQTGANHEVGSLIATLENCLFYGANSVEMPNAYDDDPTGADARSLTVAEGTTYQAALRAKRRWPA